MTMDYSAAERLPRLLLRTEGLAAAVAAVILYFRGNHPWWLLVVLALAPDLAMVAYAVGPRVGAAAMTSFIRTRFRWFSVRWELWPAQTPPSRSR